MTRLFLVAGETSGDRHAAALVAELRRRDPALQCAGLGGPAMRAAGVELLEDLTRYAVVGAVEVVRHLGTFRRLFRAACRALDAQRPDAVILVDYPGFNLRLAREATRRGIRVIYYISPQIWAWGGRRIRLIRRCVDLMLAFFPFEAALYQQAGVAVTWVGHPLLDRVQVTQPRAEALRQYGIPVGQPVLGLLPGSRLQEIHALLPVLTGAAGELAGRLPALRFLVFQAPGIPSATYRQAIAAAPAALTLAPDWDYNLLAACDLVLVASGTATLECALLERPMVMVYRTNPLTWWLGRRVVTLPYLGLVNVVAGRRLVPECLQGEATPARVAEEALSLLRSDEARQAMRRGFHEIRAQLGPPGATRRAADAVQAVLARRR